MRKLLILLIFIIGFLGDYATGDSASAAERTRCNNACPQTREPLCANNGITYANMCLFNCAKARNNRLKVTRSGVSSCSGLSLRDYRGQTTTRPTMSPYRNPFSNPTTQPPRSTSSSGRKSVWSNIFNF